MTARITEQTDGDAHVIRLEGQLGAEDARLVERLCADAHAAGAAAITIDLDGLTYLDDASASVLRGLRARGDVDFRGCCLFNKRVIDDAR